jgi:hypothetical protein
LGQSQSGINRAVHSWAKNPWKSESLPSCRCVSSSVQWASLSESSGSCGSLGDTAEKIMYSRILRKEGSRECLSKSADRVGRNSVQACRRCLCGQRRKCDQSSSVQPHDDGQLAEGLCRNLNCCCWKGRRSLFHLIANRRFRKEMELVLKFSRGQSTKSKLEGSHA